VTKKEAGMDSNYVFLCGVMWCKFGQLDAGNELLRAAESGDPDIKALARAMLAKGLPRFERVGKTDATLLRHDGYWRTVGMRSYAVGKALIKC
jgi:hypothetical protein